MTSPETWQATLRAVAARKGIELTSDQEAAILRRTINRPTHEALTALSEGLHAARAWNEFRAWQERTAKDMRT